MVIVQKAEIPLGLTIHGAAGKRVLYGQLLYGVAGYGLGEVQLSQHLYGKRSYGQSRYGDDRSPFGIYQQRKGKKGTIFVRERFYIPTNPNSVDQQFWRAKYAAGIVAWQNLTSGQKAVYNTRAKRFKFSGFNLYLKEYLSS